MMESRIIQLPSTALVCELYGEGKVGLVIEMGLGPDTAVTIFT